MNTQRVLYIVLYGWGRHNVGARKVEAKHLQVNPWKLCFFFTVVCADRIYTLRIFAVLVSVCVLFFDATDTGTFLTQFYESLFRPVPINLATLKCFGARYCVRLLQRGGFPHHITASLTRYAFLSHNNAAESEETFPFLCVFFI